MNIDIQIEIKQPNPPKPKLPRRITEEFYEITAVNSGFLPNDLGFKSHLDMNFLIGHDLLKSVQARWIKSKKRWVKPGSLTPDLQRVFLISGSVIAKYYFMCREARQLEDGLWEFLDVVVTNWEVKFGC